MYLFSLIPVLALVLVVIIFIAKALVIVRQSEVAVIERLGKFNKVAVSGLNIVIPLIDRIVRRVDMRTQVVDSEPQPVITKDNITMLIDTVIYFQVTDPFKSTYEIANFYQAIRYLASTTLRDVIGTMELDQTLASREQINGRLRQVLDEATDKWGVRVERVEVKNIEPPKDVKDAMEKQMRAEREKRAAILQAEGEKQAAITQAEGNKQAKILNAEAEKEYALRTAEGEAGAIEKVAAAEAKRIKFIYDALREANLDEKMLTLKSIEAINAMAQGDNKVFVPYEVAGILGSIGAIKEVLEIGKTDR
jgi:regulator of protease activity HflC (stomatin/prohibitin superfamily)